MSDTLGRVIAVAGSQMTVGLEGDEADEAATRIGAMVKVRSADLDVFGTVGELQGRQQRIRIAQRFSRRLVG